MSRPTGRVEIWLAAVGGFARAELLRAEAALSEQDRRRLIEITGPDQRREFLASRALVGRALEASGGSGTAGLIAQSSGQPRFEYPGWNERMAISLAHAGGFVAFAAAFGAPAAGVGVDIERTDREIDLVGIARRFFSPAEAARVAQARGEHRQDVFFSLWTLKEAYFKARGVGLTVPLDSATFQLQRGRARLVHPPDASWLFRVLRPSGLALAVAVSGLGACTFTLHRVGRRVVPS